MRVRELTAISSVALALLLSCTPAFAQSAGDEQYTDPLTPAQPDKGSTDSTPKQPAPAPAPTVQQPTSAPSPTTASAAPSTAAQASDELPRTGFPIWPQVVVAAAMLLAGVTLRRVAQSPRSLAVRH